MSILLIHGLGQTADSWRETLEAAGHPADAQCIELAELALPHPIRYPDLYRAFADRCDRMPRPLNLCGLSLGGILALHYTVEHPARVRSLVLIGAQFAMPRRLIGLQNLLFRLMPAGSFRTTGMDKADILALTRSMATLDFGDRLGAISCPVLVLCGEKDKANRAAAEALHDRILRAQLRILPGAGHELNRDDPRTLGRMLRAFWNAPDAPV